LIAERLSDGISSREEALSLETPLARYRFTGAPKDAKRLHRGDIVTVVTPTAMAIPADAS